jgi:hypothetical protein
MGGYTGGWKPLDDVWAWDPAKKTWSALALRLPAEKVGWVSACYDPERKMVVVCGVKFERRPKRVDLFGLKFDVKSVGRAEAKPVDPLMALHVPAERVKADRAGKSPKLDLAALPANTWVDTRVEPKAPYRQWGQIVAYDAKTHRAVSWGGGHSTYAGLNHDVYDLASNRWLLQKHPVSFNPRWWHQLSNCPAGVSLDGVNYVPGHSRRGYGVDPLSGAVVTLGGDVFDVRTLRFVKKMRRSPFTNSGSRNPACVTAPHGLYCFGPAGGGKGSHAVAKANVEDAKWEIVAEGGPPNHGEFNHVCYDSKRDRIIYFDAKGGQDWAFDFKSKKWGQLKSEGPRPDKPLGGSTYVPELDAACMVFGEGKGSKDGMHFFRFGDRKWYTAPYKGDRFSRANTHGLSNDVRYDPEFKVLMHFGNQGWRTGVLVMRLDAKTLELTPLAK